MGWGGVHTCAHAAGPAAAEERANSTRRPAEYCARCDRARGKPLQHCDGQAGPHASIQGTCSEHRLSCRCSHEGVAGGHTWMAVEWPWWLNPRPPGDEAPVVCCRRVGADMR